MKLALVTGGAGFIGSHLVDGLLGAGYAVRVIDDFSSGNRANIAHHGDKIDVVEGSIIDAATCQRVCHGVDVIFHQAAVPSVPRSIDQPYPSHAANIDGTFGLLMAARDAGVRRVVYAASSSAYGETQVQPKVESMASQPLSPYAVQKLTGEHYCNVFATCFGLSTIALRYFNVFGPRQNPKSQYAAAIPAFITAINEDRPPTVYGDGEQTRDFTFIKNVVNANLKAATAGDDASGQVMNIACGTAISVNRIIAMINEALGKHVQPEYVPQRAGDIKHSLADISKAQQLIGYEPSVSIEDGLTETIRWYTQRGA